MFMDYFGERVSCFALGISKYNYKELLMYHHLKPISQPFGRVEFMGATRRIWHSDRRRRMDDGVAMSAEADSGTRHD